VRTRRTLFLLIAILLLAAGVRIYRLNQQSFWADEFYSALLPAGRGHAELRLPRNVLLAEPPNLFDLKNAPSIAHVWRSDLEGHAPPLYMMAMRLWGEAFGLSQGSSRSFSVVMSLAAVALIFVVVRELSGDAAGLWAALLLALAGPQVQYAQEARTYALLLVEGLGAAAALVRIDRRGPTRWRELSLVLCVLAMALTHYFSLGAILALTIYAAVRLRGRTRMRVAACFAVAAVVWAILAAPTALRQSRNIADPQQTFFLADDAPNRVIGNLQRLGALPVRYFTEPMSHSLPAAAITGGIALLLMPLLAVRRRDLALWPLWLWLTILPLLLLDVARGTQHLTYIRYTLLASPALYGIVAALLFDRRDADDANDANDATHAPASDASGATDASGPPPRRRGRWIAHLPPSLVAIACLTSLSYAYSAWWKADWRSLAQQIDRARQPNDVVIFFGHGRVDNPNSNFLFTSFYRHQPYGPTVLMDRPPDEALARELEPFRGLLIVALDGEELTRAFPRASFRRVTFEPGAAALWRAERSP